MGTLDPRKLIELKINHMNIFHMKISQITVLAIKLFNRSKKLFQVIIINATS